LKLAVCRSLKFDFTNAVDKCDAILWGVRALQDRVTEWKPRQKWRGFSLCCRKCNLQGWSYP